jgi:hypothetical protein
MKKILFGNNSLWLGVKTPGLYYTIMKYNPQQELTQNELNCLDEADFFEYLDSKAEYLKTKSKPLSAHLVKNYAYMTEAVSNMDGNGEIHNIVNNTALETIIRQNKELSDDLLAEKWGSDLNENE